MFLKNAYFKRYRVIKRSKKVIIMSNSCCAFPSRTSALHYSLNYLFWAAISNFEIWKFSAWRKKKANLKFVQQCQWGCMVEWCYRLVGVRRLRDNPYRLKSLIILNHVNKSNWKSWKIYTWNNEQKKRLTLNFGDLITTTANNKANHIVRYWVLFGCHLTTVIFD